MIPAAARADGRQGPERTPGLSQAPGILSSGRRGQTPDRSPATSKKKKQLNSRAAGRRAAPPPRRSTEIPVLPVVVVLVLAAIAVGLFVLYRTATPTSASNAPIDGVQCDSGEHTRPDDHHYHASLTILYQGQDVTVPANIGIPDGANCLYWLHTHDDTGLLHIEAPAAKDKGFTLGQVFDIWGKKLSPTQVVDFKAGSGQEIVAYVDGQKYTGNPRDIVLKSHEQIVIEVTPPVVDPPPSFTFPANT